MASTNETTNSGTHCASCKKDRKGHDEFVAQYSPHPYLEAANDQPVDRSLDNYGS